MKRNQELQLFVDGQLISTAEAPATVTSSAANFAIGGNPNFSGPEFLAARFSDLKLLARALSDAEVKALCEATRDGR